MAFDIPFLTARPRMVSRVAGLDSAPEFDCQLISEGSSQDPRESKHDHAGENRDAEHQGRFGAVSRLGLEDFAIDDHAECSQQSADRSTHRHHSDREIDENAQVSWMTWASWVLDFPDLDFKARHRLDKLRLNLSAVGRGELALEPALLLRGLSVDQEFALSSGAVDRDADPRGDARDRNFILVLRTGWIGGGGRVKIGHSIEFLASGFIDQEPPR